MILEEGTPVNVGDTLARIADLESYRIDADLSDSYAPRLTEGQVARIKIGGRILSGRLQTILPEIQNGTMQLQLQLDDPRAEGLRANLRAEVYLVTDRREDVVTVPRGTSINGSGIKTVFVLNGDKAERREIEVGLSSYDRWEILRGIEPGENLVLSDTERF